MAFVKIAAKARTSFNDSTEITVGCYLGEGVKKSLHGRDMRHLTFRFPLKVILESKLLLTDGKIHVFIHEGTGEDAGFLMVMDEPKGYIAAQSKSKVTDREGRNAAGFSLNVSLGKFNYYTPNECPVAATPVEHAYQDGGILIQCPDWLRPNITKMQEEGLMPPEKKPPAKDQSKAPLNREQRRRLAKVVVSELNRH